MYGAVWSLNIIAHSITTKVYYYSSCESALISFFLIDRDYQYNCED